MAAAAVVFAVVDGVWFAEVWLTIGPESLAVGGVGMAVWAPFAT